MTATVAADKTKRSHRPSALLVIGILALIVALLAGGAGVLVRSQPLRAGSSSLSPPGRQLASSDPNDDRPTVLVQYVDGQAVTFGFSIKNSGRWGVTIVGLEEPTAGMLHQFSYRLSDIGFTTERETFAPFALAAHKEQAIKVTARFFNCESYVVGGGAGLDSLVVRFKILGIQRTANIPLGERIEVMSPTNANCPRPRSA